MEERCKQSFEAWQDKQKDLENRKQELFKTQRDKERRQFQEEEEKRYCWMKQFEMEKKEIEDIYRVMYFFCLNLKYVSVCVPGK